jgi:hypothetical protein
VFLPNGKIQGKAQKKNEETKTSRVQISSQNTELNLSNKAKTHVYVQMCTAVRRMVKIIGEEKEKF